MLVAPLVLSLWPTPAAAQYPPVYYPGYPPFQYAAPESSLRISVKPKEASVFVDGYFAGKVEDFDGTFQRLHVDPGQHELVIFLQGYRSLKQKLYLSPNATRKIEGELEPLAPGDIQEPEPAPSVPPDEANQYPRQPPPLPRAQNGRPGRPPEPPQPQEPPEPPVPPQPGAESAFGTLSIRVLPAGATVLIDEERWTAPGGDDRLIVQLPPGRHRLEVQKDGYNNYVTEVEVQSDRTVPVNVSLNRPR